jgi:hypothetical protein
VGHGFPLGRVEVAENQVGGQVSSEQTNYLGWNCWGSVTH